MTRLSSLQRIAVVGGGPGGAFAARLLKLTEPGAEVTLHDPLSPADTFGFGVGLSVSTQQSLSRSDPETFTRIAANSYSGHGFTMHANDGVERIAGNDQMSIARSTLLQILYEQAERVGVTIEVGAHVDAFSCDADVVVAADGVGSTTRTAAPATFGARESVGRQKFIWCGADRALPDAVFAPAQSEHGIFTTHAYPYRQDRSTFLVETDERVWRSAGFDRDMSHLVPGESDEETRAFLESLFAEHLGGATLLGNNSRWTQFRTIHCDRWHHENIVLLGDAAHTAHYSIGSGTKLAMEDAIALTEALVNRSDEGGLDRAFTAYRDAREPRVHQLQYLAHRSELWWESYVDRLALSPAQMVVSFFTRGGNVSLGTLREREPDLVGRALRAHGADPVTDDLDLWVIAQPLEHRGQFLASRDATVVGVDLLAMDCDLDDPRSPEAAALVMRCSSAVAEAGLDGVEFTGPGTREALLRRLDLAEQVRLNTGVLTSVQAPVEMVSDLAAALIAGRTDLITRN